MHLIHQLVGETSRTDWAGLPLGYRYHDNHRSGMTIIEFVRELLIWRIVGGLGAGLFPRILTTRFNCLQLHRRNTAPFISNSHFQISNLLLLDSGSSIDRRTARCGGSARFHHGVDVLNLYRRPVSRPCNVSRNQGFSICPVQAETRC